MKDGHLKKDAKRVEQELIKELGPNYYFSEIRDDGSIFFGTHTGIGIVRSKEALWELLKGYLGVNYDD